MTVVALLRGQKNTYNALVVDTIVTSKRDADERWWEEKLVHVFGNTYATAIGDSLVLDALKKTVDRLDPSRPNLRDPATIDAILGVIERQQIINERILPHHPPRHSMGAMLLVCTRLDVFYWLAEFDGETNVFRRPVKPHELDIGECLVMWGTERVRVRDLTMPTEPFSAMVKLIRGTDAHLRSEGKTGLLYPLDDRFSGITLPHKSSVAPTRLHPFASLPEQMVRACRPEQLALLDDPAFMNYRLPPVT